MTDEIENETNPIETMIDFVQNAEFNKANSIFDELITSKINDALDQEKIAVADEIFNDRYEESDDEDDEEYEDFSDEDLEVAANDILDNDED